MLENWIVMESVKEEIPLPQYSPTKQLNGVNSNLPAYQVTRSGAYYGTVESAGTPYRSTEFPVLLVGGCPVCRIGVLEEEFTWLGIMLGVVFFPIGILCCLSLRQRRCRNCGAVF